MLNDPRSGAPSAVKLDRRTISRRAGARRALALVISLTTGLGLAGGSHGADEAATEATTPRNGERLGADALGTVVVEDMAAVLERDRRVPFRLRPEERGEIGRNGQWVVPSRNAVYFPHSGELYATNKWGDTRMGIGFPEPVDVRGTWIAGQGGYSAWARSVRVVGYRDDVEVARTDWFEQIGNTPAWFPIGLEEVDRIVFEAMPAVDGGGWYAIDDLTFSRDGERVVVDFEDTGYRTVLTGSGHAGLTWEAGTGSPAVGEGVPAPMTPPGWERSDLDLDAADLPSPRTVVEPPEFLGDWEGVKRGDANQFSFPADTCGAIGPDHFVEVVNRNFAVYNKESGEEIVNVALQSFLPGSGGDPRVLYDHHDNRWVVIATDFDDQIFIAYSATDNPLGDWLKTNVIVSQGSDAGRWPDYPTLGLDEHGIYTTAYMVGFPARMSIFAIDKAPLLEDPPSLGSVVAFRSLPFQGAIQPALTYGSPAAQYFIGRASSSTFRIYELTGPITNPTLNSGLVSVPPTGDPPDAPALGSNVPPDTVDARPMNAVDRDGFLYMTHTISVNNRSAIRWYKINVSTLIDEFGTIAAADLWFSFPSIAVDADAGLLIGFSGSNPSQYVGCYYSGRQADDPPGQTSDPIQYKEGTGSINNIDGFGRNRWGDYSLTTLDPTDGYTFWTIQGYGRSSANSIWGTWFASLSYNFTPPPPGNDNCSDALTVSNGTFSFDTRGSSTDGPDEPALCSFNGETNVENDIWFRYFALCDGIATASLCDSDFNTKIAVYLDECPESSDQAIACNDDACGEQSIVSFPVTQGQFYRIRIGGFGGATGSGVVTFDCEVIPEECPADFNDDGVVDVADLLELLSAWGQAGGPADLNDDGLVDVEDLLALLNAFGDC